MGRRTCLKKHLLAIGLASVLLLDDAAKIVILLAAQRVDGALLGCCAPARRRTGRRNHAQTSDPPEVRSCITPRKCVPHACRVSDRCARGLCLHPLVDMGCYHYLFVWAHPYVYLCTRAIMPRSENAANSMQRWSRRGTRGTHQEGTQTLPPHLPLLPPWPPTHPPLPHASLQWSCCPRAAPVCDVAPLSVVMGLRMTSPNFPPCSLPAAIATRLCAQSTRAGFLG